MKNNKNGISAIFLMMLLPVITAISISPGCKDPHDYQPPEDTLVFPPRPPALFHPMDDTFFYLYGVPYPLTVAMEWSYIEDAECYFLQVAGQRESTFVDVEPIRVYSTTFAMIIDSNDRYYWRVCAYSPNWKWYTAWSPTWRFLTHYFPNE